MDGFLGEVRLFGGMFAPQNWLFCVGSLLPIAQWTPLFSIIGTNFGGDGTQTFALPDLRGNVPVGAGQTPAGLTYNLGSTGGTTTNTLTVAEMPAHSHLVVAALGPADSTNPNGLLLAEATDKVYLESGGKTSIMDPSMISPSGGSQSVPNMQPYQVLNYIMCVIGNYPTQG